MLPRVNLVKSDQGDFLTFGTDVISNFLFRNGSWEQSLLTITEILLAGVQRPLVLDIGANLGAYTIPVAKHIQNSGGTVISFEPQRIIYYQLCGNIFLNRLDNVLAENLAVGDHDGAIELPRPNYHHLHNIGGFSVEKKYRTLNGTEPSMTGDSDSIPLLKLDSMESPRSPALIKLDVEGYELNVIKGAVNFLEAHSYPPILFEAWSQEWFAEEKKDLLNFVNSLGYQVSKFGPDDHLAQHPRNARAVEFRAESNGNLQIFRTR